MTSFNSSELAREALANTGPRSQIGVNRALLAGILDLQKQVADLRRQLEAMPSLEYCGTWKESEPYSIGDFVTHGGSVWHCNAATTSRPGRGQDWTLAVKHGAAGKRG